MTPKERLNEKVAQIEKILKWIKAINDIDDHKELGNAIGCLENFTRDIRDLYSGRANNDTDCAVRFDKDLVQSFAQGELSYELQQMQQFQKAFGKTDWQLPKE